MTQRRIYLDNAATSWPKPPAVLEAMMAYMRDNGAPAGRGVYRHALEVQQAIERVRTQFAKSIHAPSDGLVVFTANGTDSLNLAIHGLLSPNDRVVTTAAEHNSVLRPLRFQQERYGVQMVVVPCDECGFVDMTQLCAEIRAGARLVVVTHASNVTGAIQPVEEIIRAAHEAGARVLLDCAQSMGHVPVNVSEWRPDMIACSAHKGLLGSLGLGLLWLSGDCTDELMPVRQGGTGTHSESLSQPSEGVERFESGNLNVPAIVALGAGLEFLETTGRKHLPVQQALTRKLAESLRATPGVTVFGHDEQRPYTDVVSIAVAGFEPQDVAAILDSQFGVQVRAGLHCAPVIHKMLGTDHQGGTIRFSLGPFNTEDEIDEAVAAVRAICGA